MTTDQQLQASVTLTQLIKTGKRAEYILRDAIDILYDRMTLTSQQIIDCFTNLKTIFRAPEDGTVVETIAFIMGEIKKSKASKKRLWTNIARVFLRALSFIIPGAAQWFTLADQIAGTYEEMYGGWK